MNISQLSKQVHSKLLLYKFKAIAFKQNLQKKQYALKLLLGSLKCDFLLREAYVPKKTWSGLRSGLEDKPGYGAGHRFYFEGMGGKNEGLKFGRSSGG